MSEAHVLVAGIGNIFFGDDAFGVEVVQRLARRPQPAGVEVKDFGIRGFDLAYALMDGPQLAILIDALPRGGLPGTLYVLDPDLGQLGDEDSLFDPHSMHPLNVLRLVRTLGGTCPPLRVVGCEPGMLGTDEEPATALSPPVAAAVPEAVRIIEKLVREACESLAVPAGQAH
ncbi:MAG TPA: hydrogenase maturation protease [Gemmataceae bacterium]|nr:hydrogenase maturation protease [Gemmataceae bacterium]